jgi:predicted RNase H-like HicB family nuclease
MPEVRLILRALLYHDDEWWIAHCLETDVVAEGTTPLKAFENLQSLTAFQVKTALAEGNLQSIFRQAPPEILSAFAIGYDQRIRRRFPKTIERFDVRTLQPN